MINVFIAVITMTESCDMEVGHNSFDREAPVESTRGSVGFVFVGRTEQILLATRKPG